MNLKIRIRFRDLIKLVFGGSIYVKNDWVIGAIRIEKGKDTYTCKY